MTTQKTSKNTTYETPLMCFYRTILGEEPRPEMTELFLSGRWRRVVGEEEFNKWYNERKVAVAEEIINIAKAMEVEWLEEFSPTFPVHDDYCKCGGDFSVCCDNPDCYIYSFD
jgi:hypothetical protein